jgi:hypothetical protein
MINIKMKRKLRKFLYIITTPNYWIPFFQNKVAASIEHSSLLKQLRNEIKTFIDIGANRGQFALVSRRFFPDALILSFEPQEEPALVYQTIFHSDKKTKLHPFAIGTEVKESLMHISCADDSSSLLPISKLQNEYIPEPKKKSPIPLP